MIASDSTRLFSNSGLTYAGMKSMIVMLFVLALVGCGGGSMSPAPVATQAAITSAQVFSNTAQTWNFADGFGHHMTIAPSPIACAFGSCGDISVWHYTKDSCAGYWNPHTPEQCAVATSLDELYFVLRHDADGAWRCIGFTYIDYLSRKWKVQILAQPGQAPPYTIIPAASNVSDPPTAYSAIVQQLAADADLNNFDAINTGVNLSVAWQTIASANGKKLRSGQHEGCIIEYWELQDGLEAVNPNVGLGNNGACVAMDARLTMVRK